MNVQCPKCLWIVMLDNGRFPPWCKKCGVDLKPHEYIPVVAQAVGGDGPSIEPGYNDVPSSGGLSGYSSAEERPVVTSVTGTGRRNWVNKPAAPTREPEVETAAAPRYTAAPEPPPAAPPGAEVQYRILAAVGVVLILVAVVMTANTWAFIKNGRETTGRVVLKFHASPGAVLFSKQPRLEYTVDGQKYDGDAGDYSEGAAVPLVYQVKNPENIRRGSPGSLYAVPLVVGIVGLGLAGGATLASGSPPAKPRD